MDLIKEIIIPNPPTKWTLVYKTPKFDKEGKPITHVDFYLTANLFYSDRTSYHITSKIIQESKMFLFPFLKGIPELDKLQLELIYYHTKHIDLDNKGFYWRKLILDILKTPTPKQIKNANQRKKPIITTNTISDDNTKVSTKNTEEFILGEHKMVIKIYGRIKSTQVEMPLFFT